ncbi:MAG: hypothetical protein ACYTBJ_00820 [Planctomycetota bacterium]|jgi:hypothetical protein
MSEMDLELSRAIGAIVENLEKYREANVGKFLGEKGTDHLGDFTKLDRYKNRVRVVDCFLKPLETILYNLGILNVHPDKTEAQRTQID